jgi:hypothetical protein
MMSHTPHVQVYNDFQPAEGQPQTPADLFADRQYQMSPAGKGKYAVDGSAFANSHGMRSMTHRPARNTYPASLAGLTIPQQDTPGRGRATFAPSPSRAARTEYGRGTDGLRLFADEENDSDGAFDELEAERRLWLDRQGRGSLDATPPKEGRFERLAR